MVMSDARARGHLACLFTIILWGTTFISTKVLLRDFKPVEILFLRFALGFLALWLASAKISKALSRGEEFLFALAGLSGICLYYLLENIALIYTSASNVGIIISVAPIFTALLAYLFLKEEKPVVSFYAGALIAFAGVALLSLNGSRLQLNPLGDLLALSAAFVWAIYSILVRKIGELGLDMIYCTRKLFAWGLIFIAPILALSNGCPGISAILKPINLINLLFLGLGASALCFVTWNYSVRALGAVLTSAYIYLVPVVTASAAWLVLDEKISHLALGGIILTIAGLLLSQWRKVRPQAGKMLSKL